MAGEDLSPEAREMLPKATNEIAALYLGDQLSNLLRNQTPQERDEFWNQAAAEYSPFAENIRGLREALKSVDVTKRAYPAPVTNVMGLHFSEVSNEVAKAFLTDVLFARITSSPGYIDYSMDAIKEAEAMARELGATDGLRGQQIKTVNLDQTVGAVLTGDLRVSYQGPTPS